MLYKGYPTVSTIPCSVSMCIRALLFLLQADRHGQYFYYRLTSFVKKNGQGHLGQSVGGIRRDGTGHYTLRYETQPIHRTIVATSGFVPQLRPASPPTIVATSAFLFPQVHTGKQPRQHLRLGAPALLWRFDPSHLVQEALARGSGANTLRPSRAGDEIQVADGLRKSAPD